MADATEPKKETVRIALSPKLQPPEAGIESGDTTRIRLVAQPPSAHRPMPASSAPEIEQPIVESPLPPPISAAPLLPKNKLATGLVPVKNPPFVLEKENSHISDNGPKKETARISVLPDLPRPSIVQMKRTQPISRMPETVAPNAPLHISSPREHGPKEANANRILAPFCWALFVVSVAILIIQIWTYLS